MSTLPLKRGSQRPQVGDPGLINSGTEKTKGLANGIPHLGI